MAHERRKLAEIPAFPTLVEEMRLWGEGFGGVCGLDEAGRGAWAGPVSAGAVVLPAGGECAELLAGVRDSKQMTAASREFWAAQVRACAAGWGLGFASNQEIDSLGIIAATRLAMQRALQDCMERLAQANQIDFLLIDALRLPDQPIRQKSLIHGDASSLSIAAASILAKTARDQSMRELDELHPGYAWAANKGYGTRAHRQAIQDLGCCALHRRSFNPLRELLQDQLPLAIRSVP